MDGADGVDGIDVHGFIIASNNFFFDTDGTVVNDTTDFNVKSIWL
jgi:hypothetical protein